MAEIAFTAAAVDDLRRLGRDAVPKILKKVLLLADDAEAGYPLGGELTSFRKLVGRNTWRIVYRITDEKVVEVCEVWAVGKRADAAVYAEAAARIRKAGRVRPELIKLADVIDQLGWAVAGATFEPKTPREPVPDWLADRLVLSAGMRREEVAALDLQEAVDCWTAFMSKPS